MTVKTLPFDAYRALLRRPSDDPAVVAAIGGPRTRIEREQFLGWVSLKDRGVEVMFNDASRMLPGSGKRGLVVSCVHLYSQGLEGHTQYAQPLPGNVAFGDSADDVIQKLGTPVTRGGGNMNTVLKKRVPYWLRYLSGDTFLQFQLDDSNRVQQVAIYAPEAL